MNISIDHNREKKIISNEVQRINDRNGLLRLWNWDLLTVHEELRTKEGRGVWAR